MGAGASDASCSGKFSRFGRSTIFASSCADNGDAISVGGVVVTVAACGVGNNDCGDCSWSGDCRWSGDDEAESDSSCRGNGGSGRTLVFSLVRVFEVVPVPATLGLGGKHSAGITGGTGDEADTDDGGGARAGASAGVGCGGVEELERNAEVAVAAAVECGLWLMLLAVVVLALMLALMCWRREGGGGRVRDGESMLSELNRRARAAAAAAGVRGNTGSARLRLRP